MTINSYRNPSSIAQPSPSILSAIAGMVTPHHAPSAGPRLLVNDVLSHFPDNPGTRCPAVGCTTGETNGFDNKSSGIAEERNPASVPG